MKAVASTCHPKLYRRKSLHLPGFGKGMECIWNGSVLEEVVDMECILIDSVNLAAVLAAVHFTTVRRT